MGDEVERTVMFRVQGPSATIWLHSKGPSSVVYRVDARIPVMVPLDDGDQSVAIALPTRRSHVLTLHLGPECDLVDHSSRDSLLQKGARRLLGAYDRWKTSGSSEHPMGMPQLRRRPTCTLRGF